MPDIKKIVFPVDFSARSEGAAQYVDVFAEKYQPAIEMIHVLPFLHYETISLEISGPALGEVLASREIAAKKQIADFLKDKLASHSVNRSVLDGDPAEEIVKFATESQSDLIVMPTHGYGRFRRFILGSVTSKVLHDAKIPVLTGVHLDKAPEKVDIRTIIAAVDLGKQSEAVLAWAGGVARKFGAKLVVTHVVEGINGTADGVEDPMISELHTEPAKKKIRELLSKTGTEAESIVISFGVPSKQICEVAEAENASLAVIGRGISEGVLGRLRTQSYAVIRMAPCPVVSV